MSPLFRRRSGRTDDARLAGFSLEPDERVLATARTPDGPVVATTRRLAMPGDSQPVGWDQIDRASWDEESGQLVVNETAALGASSRRHRIAMPEPSSLLLDVIREQVNATVLLSRYERVAETGGVRVTGRRRPGYGEIVWTVTPDRGVDLSDAAVRTRVDAFVTRVRGEVE